jgi:hypothetical protein
MPMFPNSWEQGSFRKIKHEGKRSELLISLPSKGESMRLRLLAIAMGSWMVLGSYSLAISKDLDPPQQETDLGRPIGCTVTLTPITISHFYSYRLYSPASIGPVDLLDYGETVHDFELGTASAESKTNWSTVGLESLASDFPANWTIDNDTHSYGSVAFIPVSVRTISWNVDASLPRAELTNRWFETPANWSQGHTKPAIEYTVGDDFASAAFVETKLSSNVLHNDPDCRWRICIDHSSKPLTLNPNSDEGGSMLGVMTSAPHAPANATSAVTGGCIVGHVLTI